MTEQLPAITESTTPDAFRARLDDARAKASILKEIVSQQKLSKVINNREYLYVEAWQVIAAGYGLSARVVEANELFDNDDPAGWEATAEVVTSTGQVVGRASSECGTRGDGDWIRRASYQQRSMAQTRAIAKAFRSVLSWVVVMAGYEPTPADEMPADAPTIPATVTHQTITHEQRRRMFAIANANEVPRETVRAYLSAMFGDESTANLTIDQYDMLCDWLENPNRRMPSTDA